MKNEWDFFADVQQRLAAGQTLVTGYFKDRLVLPFDEQRGIVLDEDGTEYELGSDYRLALTEGIRGNQINWCLRFQERLICFGPDITAFDLDQHITFNLDGEATIE
jgi:hypothetical protein